MKMGTLCYLEEGGKVLLLNRTKKKNDMHKNLWVGLGGKFEAGESPEECVVREVFEESGLLIHAPKLRGILTFPNDFNQEDWYVFLYTARTYSGELRPCEEGELAWIDWAQVDELPMHEGDRLFLRMIREQEGLFSIKFLYEDGKLKDYRAVRY